MKLESQKTSKESGRVRILLVSTADIGGGAEISAWNLFHKYRGAGYYSQMAVGSRYTDDPDVLLIPKDSDRNAWARFWISASKFIEPLEGRVRGTSRARNLCRWIGEPGRSLAVARGYEDFDYPGTWKLLEYCRGFDLVHCFNLHPDYFDLRILPRLSNQLPVLLDLRDAWLLSGHCAHSFDCERWSIGCGQCPDLNIYPSIRRDGSAFNWQRKKNIFSTTRLYVATPSQWLMNKIRKSMLDPGIIESRIIPTGIDLSVFHPSERAAVRAKLDISQNAKVLLFAGNEIRRNMFKDYPTMLAAVRLLAERKHDQPLLFIALGENALEEQIGNVQMRFVAHMRNPKDVAAYYQAADIYVHAAAADTFPRTVLEALACGTPVVATGVGGIPEQIKSLWNDSSFDGTGATGIVVPPGDAQAMAISIEKLLTNDLLTKVLSRNATIDARLRFDLAKQANCYLDWYEQMVHNHQKVRSDKIIRSFPLPEKAP